MSCGPLDVDKGQILFREQSTEGTAESLTAADAKIRLISGTTPEYSPERNPRNIARGTLTPIGNIEGKKSISIPFSTEINTPDTFNIAATSEMTVSAINWQSDNIVRYTFSGTPDLSGVVDGSYLTCNYAGTANNNGTFLVIAVNDGSDYVDVLNRLVTDASGDETTGGECTIQTNLEYQGVMNCCGMNVKGASRLAGGAVTSGPFQHGETLTGDVSGATGRCLVPTANGDSYIYFEVLTGKFTNLDTTITGGTSGASMALSSATPAVHGYHVIPRSNCQASGTIEYQEDGKYWQGRDVMGNLTGTIQASQQGILDFTMQGPRSAIGDKALTTSVTRSTEEPPVCKNADLKFDSYEPVFSQVGFDLGNNVVLRANGNAADDTGYEGARIAGTRDGKFTATVELVLATDYDFYTKLDAGTKIAVEGRVGTSENKQFWYFFPYVELDEIPLGEIDKIRTLDITGSLTGLESSAGDDEYEFVFIGN